MGRTSRQHTVETVPCTAAAARCLLRGRGRCTSAWRVAAAPYPGGGPPGVVRAAVVGVVV